MSKSIPRVLVMLLSILLAVSLSACGGGGGSSGGDGGGGNGGDGNGGGGELTQEEKDLIDDTIEEVFTSTFNDTVNTFSVTQNSVAPATINNFPIFNQRQACFPAGRSTVNGNIKFDDETGDIYGQLTIDFSDPTNNLNDCEIGNGLILDGTVFVSFYCPGTFTIDGNIEVSRRGSGGGLVPINSNFGIFITGPCAGAGGGGGGGGYCGGNCSDPGYAYCEASWGNACCPDGLPHYYSDGNCYQTISDIDGDGILDYDFVLCGCPVN